MMAITETPFKLAVSDTASALIDSTSFHYAYAMDTSRYAASGH
jgi:hypothetical protein